MQTSTYDRLTNIAFISIAAVAISASAYVRPAESGIGTHEKLGLPPCYFHKVTGLPCFSCGMTTSWSWMAHGHPVRSFLTQPMGAFLFITAIVAGVWSLYCLFAGGTVERRLAGKGRILMVVFWAGMLGGWAYKIVETLGT